ncbi:hypothetical protein [Escherichia coli]|uniref:hypothetical protein n=1 Tax=Escherichia coli TaxID=562 RepID=UPI00259C93E1|nr:hypothetical protein [Escherichia coli]MDM4816196.1 hypothetical protein [Escherichia coli]
MCLTDFTRNFPVNVVEFFAITLGAVVLAITIDAAPEYSPSGSLTTSPHLISPLIGHLKLTAVSFKCPLRGDIRCGDVIELPEGLYSGAASIVMANTTAPSVIAKNSTTFTGKFLVKSVRHIGSYLTADGDAWVTVFEAYAENWARV